MPSPYAYVQFEFATPALLRLIQFNLTLNQSVVGQEFAYAGDTYHGESVQFESNAQLLPGRPISFVYTWHDYLNTHYENLAAKSVEVGQRFSIALSKVRTAADGSKTYEDGEVYSGRLIVRLSAYPVEYPPEEWDARFEMELFDIEVDEPIAPGFKPAFRSFVYGAFPLYVSSNLPTFLEQRDQNGAVIAGSAHVPIENLSVAASRDGSRVAVRVQIGAGGSPAGVSEWTTFLDGDYADALAGPGGQNHWAVVLSDKHIAGLVRLQIEQALADHQDDLRLVSGVGVAWTPQGGQPRLEAHWRADILKACDGIGSVGYDLTAAVTLSVPSDNVLVSENELNRDADDFELFACEALAGFAAALVGAGIGGIAGGWAGAAVGAAIGGAAGFISAVIVASVYMPDISTPDCQQDGKKLTCTSTISTELRLGNGAPLQLSVARVTGLTDGLVLAGDLPLLPPLLGTRAFFSQKPFAWTGPKLDCGGSALLTLAILPNLRDFAAAVASVTVTNDPVVDGGKVRVLSVERVSPDPFGYFPDSLVRIRDYGDVTVITFGAQPTAADHATPYGLSVRVTTNGGARVLDLGAVPPLSDAAVEKLKGDALGSISDCFVQIDDFTRRFGRLNPKWLIDPPPESRIADLRRLWQVEVRGLAPREELEVFADGAVRHVAAGENGVAQIRELVHGTDFGFRRLPAGRAALPEHTAPLRYVTHQTQLAALARFRLKAPPTALDLAFTHGVPTLAILAGGEIQVFDLTRPALPRLIFREAPSPARTLALGEDGLYLAVAHGLDHWSFAERARTRLLDSPVSLLVREGAEIVTETRGETLRLRPQPFGVRRPETAARSCGRGLTARLDEEIGCKPSPHLTPVPLAGTGRLLLEESGQRWLLLDTRGEKPRLIETYVSRPWFADARTLRRLLVAFDPRSSSLVVYHATDSAGSYPREAAAAPAPERPPATKGCGCG